MHDDGDYGNGSVDGDDGDDDDGDGDDDDYGDDDGFDKNDDRYDGKVVLAGRMNGKQGTPWTSKQTQVMLVQWMNSEYYDMFCLKSSFSG